MAEYRYENLVRRVFTVGYVNGPEASVTCLWHSDNSPSMNFNMETGMHICFSCGYRGGINKLQKYLGEKWTDVPTMDDLKSKLEKISTPAKVIDPLPESSLLRYKFKTDYWTQIRGFSQEAVDTYQLGYDPLENHAIIPVRDYHGKLATFIRRDLDPDAHIRYYNGKNFARKTNLFSAWLSDSFGDDARHAVLCEGPSDAISIWDAGFFGMAQYGSSISIEQVMVLRKLGVEKVTLFYDNDKAGQRANGQAIELLRGNFLINRVKYRKSDAKDPGGMSKFSLAKRIVTAERIL